jgi:thymidylate synthase ThyX
MITADIIADSISYVGKRITTLSLYYPRFIHAEFMTHRMFSRNASSSRAIPTEKLIQDIIDNPVEPVYWGKNTRGMQAKEALEGDERDDAIFWWKNAQGNAITNARMLDACGVHKQIVNRILEPYSHIRVCVTATEWDNFFALRLHPAAQPEIQALAKAMKDAIDAFTPVQRNLGEWHLPYVSDEERITHDKFICLQLSVARCARVSYRLHDGTHSSVDKDIALCKRLFDEGHMSPFEHQAEPSIHEGKTSNNFRGWFQYRAAVET